MDDINLCSYDSVRVQADIGDAIVPSPTAGLPGLPGMPDVPDTEAAERGGEWAGDRPDSMQEMSSSSLKENNWASSENTEAFGWIKDVLGGHISGTFRIHIWDILPALLILYGNILPQVMTYSRLIGSPYSIKWRPLFGKPHRARPSLQWC